MRTIDTVLEYLKTQHEPLTTREIACAVELSRFCVRAILDKLVKEKLLKVTFLEKKKRCFNRTRNRPIQHFQLQR